MVCYGKITELFIEWDKLVLFVGETIHTQGSFLFSPAKYKHSLLLDLSGYHVQPLLQCTVQCKIFVGCGPVYFILVGPACRESRV